MRFMPTGRGFHNARGRRYVAIATLLTCLSLSQSCGSATDAEPVPVAAVIVSAARSQLIVGENHQVSLRLEDAAGKILTNRTTVWSTTSPGVAIVSEIGLVRAVAPGNVQIIATSEGVTGSVSFGVVPAVAAVTMESPPTTRLIRGTTRQLSAIALDNNGTPLSGRPITWSTSNSFVASVTQTGLVEGIAPGSVRIIAEAEGRSAFDTFTVVEPVARVTVEPAAASLLEGQSLPLNAYASDAAGFVLFGRTITWVSTNSTVARVSDGLVTAVTPGGPVLIVASSEGKADTTTIMVLRDPCRPELPIALRDTVTGTLLSGDCQLDDASYIDFWRFTLTAETDILIEMNSAAFNTWLWLTDADRNVIAVDNNSGPGTNSRIRIRLLAGTYVIGANSLAGGESGAYSLSLNTDPNAAACALRSPIAVDDTVTGVVAKTDCVIQTSFYADAWRLQLSSRQTLDIQIKSPNMEPFVLVADLEGNIVGFDEAGGGTDFTLNTTLEAGQYDVWATTWWADSTGNYELSIRQDRCSMYGSVTLGQTVSGALAAGDCVLNDGSLADPWLLTVTDSTLPVRIDLSSSDFDAYLVLTDLFGNLVATDDDGGPGSSARIETTLCCGQYLVWANSYVQSGRGTYSLTVDRLAPAPVNLVVDGAYLVQGTQRYTGTVPLIAGKNALIRVFGRASLGNSSAPAVRVRLYDASSLVETMTLTSGASTVTTIVREGTMFYSWNAIVPAARVKPGLSFTAEIDPNAVIAESDETDNVWPQDGQPKAVDVRSVPKLNLTFVPVRQQVNGLLGNITTSNVTNFTDLTRRLYPLDTVNALVRATYTTTLPALQAGDENGAWWDLLAELEAIRAAENPTHHYYGVVKVGYSSGVGGISMGIPARTAAGADFTNASLIVAHELGHNFGRYHAPCGGAGGPDPDYPYNGGVIGVYGFDQVSQTVIQRTATDIMGYCTPPWISDYTFEGVLNYRASNAAPPPVAQSVMLVWGTIMDGKPKVEPAFRLVASPLLPARSGAWRVELRDVTGRVIDSHAFTPTEIHDGARAGAAFTFALPIDSASADRVASIAVIGPTGQSEIIQSLAARTQAKEAGRHPSLLREGLALNVTWSTDRYPMAMVRDARTGNILSLVRGGKFTIPTGSPALDVMWSDGVHTHRERLVP